MSQSPLLRIENVHIYPRDESQMWGGWIDTPKKGDEIDVYSLNLTGWALGRTSRAVAIEYLHAGAKLGRVPIDIERPDIPKAFPNAQEALASGFRASISVVPLPLESDIFIQAVLADETRVPLAVISVKRQPIAAGFQPRLRPLLISTLGRTGSTWVVRVLGEHPQITAYRPFEYEPRLLTYWLAMLKSVAEPGSYARALTGDLDNGDWWNETGRSETQPAANIREPAILQWLGRTNVEETARFAMQRVDDFYSEVARAQGKSGAVFFAEKGWPEIFVPQMVSELCPGAKEIILVRDFRDVVSSILSFNKKRGYAAFGRQHADSDRQFIRQFRPHAVRMLEHWRERGNAAHLLRYEDLILRPEPTLAAVLGYLGLDASEPVIRATLDRAAALPREVQQGHSTSKDPAASVGRWRSDLDDPLKAECAEAFGDVLGQFGYNP